MNGKPGDHPITDIVVHGLDPFGTQVSGLIRELDRLLGRQRLRDLPVDWFSPPPRWWLAWKLRSMLRAARKDALVRGWETDRIEPHEKERQGMTSGVGPLASESGLPPGDALLEH